MSEFKELMAEHSYVAVHGKELQELCHQRAVKAGWWTRPTNDDQLFSTVERNEMVPTKLMLTVSELSEAMEAHRTNARDTHLPERDGLEVELADALIRIYDLGGALGYDLGAAMAEKMDYNLRRKDHSRGHRQAQGGKRY